MLLPLTSTGHIAEQCGAGRRGARKREDLFIFCQLRGSTAFFSSGGLQYLSSLGSPVLEAVCFGSPVLCFYSLGVCSERSSIFACLKTVFGCWVGIYCCTLVGIILLRWHFVLYCGLGCWLLAPLLKF
ncbi:hypothetical protein GDO81_020878 [Engystomops pustulosus]|uniref:Uncharacterized protein n=1 Tax=Engystomops pustulosus TaxID=76066 RepID=A0AAV6YZK2_ENGPU|nr:hypothetical protein GDO81_020878 [Engystomops pustulosus]